MIINAIITLTIIIIIITTIIHYFLGFIPDEICDLVNLVNLRLCENNFQGSIPKLIGSLKELKFLHLDNNKLSGKT
jgi:Leucine-rich repeat (LRR) protein